MRSRVTANDWPTSSGVCSLPWSRPKRILMIFSSRGVSVFSTDAVCSFRLRLMTASEAVVSPSDAVINLNLKEQTASVLKTLTPREEKIIKMRFGLDHGSEHTPEE